MMSPLIPRVPDDWVVWAFSDPHGVATGLETALIRAGLVDDRLRWIAPPRTALVGRGDCLDRGAASPRVVALVRLTAGGPLRDAPRMVVPNGPEADGRTDPARA
jgi:hypothetical protein